ncbi:MAG: DUF11 domain-containing protein [Verrucomicrobiae bacterium]|nr:DUF11 domain-containing protein [Verrucomicrobiae bacterium]
MKLKLFLLGAAVIAICGNARAQFDPSARDQHMLELVNRMRLNPAAELPLLTNATDANVQAAISGFHVDLSVLAQQWATLTPMPPLAWNAALYDAALGHSQMMLDFDLQSHQLPGEADIGQRATDAGYDFSVVGESIFAFAKSVFHAHAAWAIDWGNTATGIQDPPGHRENIMDPEFREFGFGLIEGTGVSTNLPHVGPMEMTQDYGSRFDFGDPFLLGVAFEDMDEDGFYSEGEGLAVINVSVEAVAGPFNTNITTLTAGGYQVQVPTGMYQVTFSGGVLVSDIVQSVTLSTENVKLDLVLEPPPPLPSADLAIKKTDSPDPVIVDSNLTYTIVVTNLGTDVAANVTVTDSLPSNVTFVSASEGCTNIDGHVICDLGDIASGSSVTNTIVVAPTTIGISTNSAVVSSITADPVVSNNTAMAITTVTLLQADLAVSKTDSPDPIGVGSNLTYTITVTNRGPDTTASVTLIDTLPPGVTFVSASTGCGEVGGTVTCELGSLASGGTSNITIVVTTTAAGTITNTALVAGAESDPVQGNNTAQAVTTVTTPPQLDDLSVNVTNKGITCTNTTKGIVCTGNGTLSLLNIGVEYGAGTFTLTSTCKVKPGKPTKCKLAGVLNLTSFNLGNTPSAILGLYLSDDDMLDGGDVKLLKKEISTAALEALFDKLKAFKIKGTIPAGTELSGKFILVVIDTTGIVVESDEDNNYAAFGPLP